MNSNQRILGFGLDAQYANKYPGGIVNLCEQYYHRLSHLSIVSLFDKESAQLFIDRCAKQLPVIHHLPGVAPADPDGPHEDLMQKLEIVSQTINAKWICEDIAIWRIGPYGIPYFTPPIFEQEVADKIANGIKEIQKISSIPFCAEIPSCALVAGTMPIGAFFHSIIEQANCKMVCDVSHVYSYAIARNLDPFETLQSFPLDAVWELHISGGHIDANSNQRYIDTHSEPILGDIIDLLAQATKDCPNLKCITYEVGVGLSEELIEYDFSRIEKVLQSLSWTPFREMAVHS